MPQEHIAKNLVSYIPKRLAILLGVCLLSSCVVTPKPYTTKERYKEAQENIKHIFAAQKKIHRKLDYYTAIAYGLRYNLDTRVKFVNSALQADQLDLAAYAMYPALNVSGSLYSRNNDLSTLSTTTTGSPTDTVTSTPRTLQSARNGLSWNILDFGLSYVRAKQQADRYLIAKEEVRKQLQQLVQDITRSYWEAYNAQQLLKETRDFRALLARSKRQLEAAVRDKTIPQQNILEYQGALLESDRQMIQLKNKYTKALINLKKLLNIPIAANFTLDAPPSLLKHANDLSKIDLKKLDAITLVQRPELRGQSYQERIAKLGVKSAILQALPGITLSPAWNYNSNKFLANNRWMDASGDLAWNLLNLASLPKALESSRGQVDYEKLKTMAITVTVLTEVRYSLYRYQNTLEEYTITHKQTNNAKAMHKLTQDRNRASLASTQQILLSKFRTITAKMDEDLLRSDLTNALGELYLSVGFDILPYDLGNEPVEVIARKVKERFAFNKTRNFSQYVDETYQKLFPKKKKEKQHGNKKA